jgi:preprotein translocase subunit SecG
LNILLSIVLVVQVLSALGVIVLVLLQHGKGADMGAAFGSGASGSLFGATGSANFLSRTTAALAAVFFVCTLMLSFLSAKRPTTSRSVMESVATPSTKPAGDAPAAPANTVPADAATVGDAPQKEGKPAGGAEIPK